MKPAVLLTAVALSSCGIGCYGASDVGAYLDGDGGTTTGTPPPSDPPPAYPPPSDPDGGSGLPCDVIAALQSCTTCHGSTPAGGAPMPLVTFEDLAATSPGYAPALMIDRAIARMGDAQRPMPPSGPAPQADIDVLQNWRNAGMPGTGCGTPPMEPQTVCSSGTTWSWGNEGSSRMNPGKACIACHSTGEGPRFVAAGTLYPTIREPDLCNGANGQSTFSGVQVELIDANGTVFPMSVNSAGNFSLQYATVVKPYTARVVYQGKTRTMATPQQSGDCNSCHTEKGLNGAPGRVTLPE